MTQSKQAAAAMPQKPARPHRITPHCAPECVDIETAPKPAAPVGESCGTHYPAACPPRCFRKGDRFSKAQIDAQKPAAFECWTCRVNGANGVYGLDGVMIERHRAAGHDVREVSR